MKARNIIALDSLKSLSSMKFKAIKCRILDKTIHLKVEVALRISHIKVDKVQEIASTMEQEQLIIQVSLVALTTVEKGKYYISNANHHKKGKNICQCVVQV